MLEGSANAEFEIEREVNDGICLVREDLLSKFLAVFVVVERPGDDREGFEQESTNGLAAFVSPTETQ